MLDNYFRMRDNENLYDKLRELIGKTPENFSIMEDTIDIDLQLEYFEYSKRISQEFNDEWAMDQIDLLVDPDYSLESKKMLLARLATMENVKAYRAIESYLNNPDVEIRDWSLMAFQESKMHLESHLLEESQIFISTGLGGKNNKLRYFVVLIARHRENLSEFQKKIVLNEFSFVMNQYEVEIEEFDTSGYLATFLLLLPIQHSVKDVFSEGIAECNQFGDFLRENCIVTNVKKLSFDEIIDFIELKKKNDHSEEIQNDL
jgi:hypothetical protein